MSSGSVGVILTYYDDSLPGLLEMIEVVAQQATVSTKLLLICDSEFFARHEAAITAAVGGSIAALTPLLLDLARVERVPDAPLKQTTPTGPKVAEALRSLDTDYFCFLRPDESWFHDHLASLIAAMAREPGTMSSVSGVLAQKVDAAKITRSVASLRFDISDVDLLNARYASEYGRFLFSKAVVGLVPMDCLSILDGQEPNLVRLIAALQGEPAQTGYATYVRDLTKADTLPGAIIPEEQQQQFIRDAVALDSRWLSRMTIASQPPQHIYAYSRGAPVRFDQFQHPLGVTRYLSLDQMVDTTLGADGTRFLEHGFSPPEKEGVWIEADHGAVEFYIGDQPRTADQDFDLVVVMRGRPSRDTGRQQHATIVLNGVAIAYAEIPEHHAPYSFRLPRNALSSGRMRVQLIPDHAELVYDEKGAVTDNRRLSIHVRQFGLMSRHAPPRPLIFSGHRYDVREGAEVLPALRDGFSYAETNWVWCVGRTAQIGFQVRRFSAPMLLRLSLTGRASKDGAVQRVTIQINSRPAGVFELDGPEVQVVAQLTADMVDESGICAVTLAFSHAEPVLDANGAVSDSRLLAAQLHWIEVDPTGIAKVLQRLKRKAGALLRRV